MTGNNEQFASFCLFSLRELQCRQRERVKRGNKTDEVPSGVKYAYW